MKVVAGSFLKKKLIACAVFIVASIACEMFTFLLLGFGFFPTDALINLSIIFFIAGIIFIIPYHTISAILSTLLLIGQSTLACINIVLYTVLGDIFTLDMIGLSSEAQTALQSISINWLTMAPFVLICIAYIAIQVVLLVKVKNSKFSLKSKNVLALATMLFVFCALSPVAGVIRANNLSDEAQLTGISQKQNFDNITYKVSFFRSFGTFPLMFKNIILQITPGSGVLPSQSTENTKDYFGSYIDFQSEYHAVDNGNNFIVIMLESMDTFLIDETYTPTLYTLLNESITFEGYHTQAKTDVSEASGIFGSYPYTGKIVKWDEEDAGYYDDNRADNLASAFPFSIPNLLKNQGYEQTTYIHTNDATFYSRKFTHPTFGFDNCYFLDNFDIEDKRGWYTSEKECLEYIMETPNDLVDPMPKDKQFCLYFTTTHAHGGYDQGAYNSDPTCHQYYELIDDIYLRSKVEPISDAVYTRYKIAMAKAMVADAAVQYIIEKLEERNLTDKTTLLLYADHNAYLDDLTFNIKAAKNTTPAYHLPAAIWSPNVQDVKLDKFVNTYDLIITALDILGIEFNSKMYLGVNAFDTEQSIVYSKQGIIFNDKYCTDGMKLIYASPEATTENLQEFQTLITAFIEKWSYINNLFFKGSEAYFQT